LSGVELGALMFGVLVLLLLARVPIGAAMFGVGVAGYVWLAGWLPLASYLKNAAFGRFAVYDLSVVPLFLLMGNFATHGGLSRALFGAAAGLIGHFRGGMAMAGIGACAGFGAICGSSLATAATMGQVALPELRRHGYSPRLATGALAAGGTLGILIPPSVVLVIYAILAQQNIGKLFAAAVVPGVLAALGYMAAVAVYVRLHPGAGPAGPRLPWRERLRELRGVWPVLAIFLTVVGGIYGGVFTPTEAASVGTLATALLAWSRGMRRRQFVQCLLSTAESTAMIFFILLGADLLNVFLALSQLPAELAAWVQGLGAQPLAVLFAILLLYVLLGCLMDALSMILLTVPIFLPIVLGLDLFGLEATEKAIWFGVLALMVVEIGLITPPVGMNVYIINSLARDVPMAETFRGVAPFLIADALRIVVLVLFPVLSLALVRWMQ
jgi:tripartite ATP-independent transporter DctM subunit